MGCCRSRASHVGAMPVEVSSRSRFAAAASRCWLVRLSALIAGSSRYGLALPNGLSRQVLSQELRDPGSGIGRREADGIAHAPTLVHLVHLVHTMGHLFHLVN